MGVDCVIELPPTTRLKDVASVIGRLLGCSVVKEALNPGDPDSWYANVKGVEIRPSCVPECAEISVRPPGKDPCGFLYHFEGNGGCRLLMPRSRARAIAMGNALVDFFGGTVTASDWDNKVTHRAQTRDDIGAEDGAKWSSLQQRITDVQPLTEQDIAACIPLAAYTD